MDKDNKTTFDYLYRVTWQNISKMYNEEAIKRNSLMTVGFVLVNIDYKNGTPSTALGPKMGIEPTSLSRTLKKMEENGLIYREKNPNDGRGVFIKLTDKGKEKREISKQIILTFDNKVRENLSQEQIDNFIEVTNVINELVINKRIF
ncbi:MarR family transcriptional regulator [Flavobacteriaceae bacterium]|nr:MarR family transcriptional regulator [Flavobacteriaceae bacterium]